MAHGKDTRDTLKRHYVHDRLSLDKSALLAGVSTGTASRWKKEALANGDDWDKLRTASLLAGDGIEGVARQMVADYLVQHQAVMEQLADDKDMKPLVKAQLLASMADSFNKTVAASKKVLPETNELATAMQVVQKLAEYVRAHFPQHAPAFAEILEPFGEELARCYG